MCDYTLWATVSPALPKGETASNMTTPADDLSLGKGFSTII
jgi:hypothetical protein